MDYRVIYDPEAVKFLDKVSQALRARIVEKIASTKQDPFRYFERLEGRTDYKLRVGDYRAIADIKRREKRIEVTLIDHRKNVYKRLRNR